MPKEFDNTNRGMLFRVAKKKSEKHPDLNGKLNIDGTDYWFSGWWKVYTDSETGEKRTGVSLSLGDKVQARSKSEMKRRDAQGADDGADTRRPTPQARGKFDDMEDDIPF